MMGAVLLVLVVTASSSSQGRIRLSIAGMALPGLVVACSLHFGAGVGELVVGVAFALSTGFAWAGVIPAPWATQVATAFGSGVALGGTLLLARLASWLEPTLAVVIFAVVFSALEGLGSRTSPYGEWGSLAHSQVRQPWALAIARLGPQAVTFALVLVSGGIGYAISLRSLGAAVTAAIGFAVVTAAWGVWLRNSRADDWALGCQVTGLVERDAGFFTTYVGAFVRGGMDPSSWKDFDTRSRHNLDELLERSLDAGCSGARVVGWAEGAGLLSAGDYGPALDRARHTARNAHCVLVASWLILDRSDGFMSNVVTVITDRGEVASAQTKQRPVPGPEAQRTRHEPARSAVVDSDVGRLGVAICFDADHHVTWAGLKPDVVGVVVIPASDWPAIGSLHADMARLRSRSIGAAMIRPARSGISLITDRHGRIVNQVDHRQRPSPDLTGLL